MPLKPSSVCCTWSGHRLPIGNITKTGNSQFQPGYDWQANLLSSGASFEADPSIDTIGTVKLTWVGTGGAQEAGVTRADAPKVLECAKQFGSETPN